MNKYIKYLICGLLLLGGAAKSGAQGDEHTKFKLEVKKVGPDLYDLVLKATMAPKWHLYSAKQINLDGPIPIEIVFNKAQGMEFVGKVKEEGKLQKEYDEGFGQETYFYSNTASFIQRVKSKALPATITGTIYGQNCNEDGCQLIDRKFSGAVPAAFLSGTPPQTEHTAPAVPGSAKEPAASIADTGSKEGSLNGDSAVASTEDSKLSGAGDTANKGTQIEAANTDDDDDDAAKRGLLALFLGGFGGGLIALLTPCVFPIIPLTVSFFTKQSSKGSAIGKSLIFGFAIIFLYVSLGLLVSRIFGYQALNELSSNVYMNLAFFVMFTVFAFSFLGAFEITLPASWSTRADQQSEKGGIIGIFFIAFTLAIVSFSCTGPIVGNLLVLAANGSTAGPVIGMLGFSTALALPFMVFSAFPSLMKSLPRSGGWLNSVKVVMGFIELALALKFLSNADLTYHWGLLKREIFIAFWVIIFTLNGFYLLGKLQFSHDSPAPYISVPRLVFALFSLTFALYMLPGMWGAPINALSGILPPKEYKEWKTNAAPSTTAAAAHATPRKTYGIQVNHGFDAWFDYDEAMAEAKRVNKPLLLDFTGHNCSNCRRMEDNVWTQPEVEKLIRDEYVLVSLYYDDRTLLPENERRVLPDGTEINTVGRKVSHFEYEKFKSSTQPFYALLGHDGELLVKPVGYTPDVAEYTAFLRSGVQKFKQQARK